MTKQKIQNDGEVMEYQFTLQSDHIELYKVLKIIGLVASGGQAKQLISDGCIAVNGMVELQKRKKCKPNDVIEFDNQTIRLIE